MGRFRIKQGEFEVEYEGEDSAEKYNAAIKFIENVPKVELAQKENQAKQNKKEGQARTAEHSSAASLEGFELPSKGKLGKIEFSSNGLKFPPLSFTDLTTDEAIGLLLYELDKPVRPAVITALLTKGWKKITPNNVRGYLTSKKMNLAKYVVKEEAGYRLTGHGNQWVKETIAPKL